MEFNPQKQLAGLLEWMDQQMTQCGGKTAVIGISGGKDSSTVAALAVADSVLRLQPGVLAEEKGYQEESHWNGLLEYPQYTRPEEWRGRRVPEVLLSGHHVKIAEWRARQSLERTRQRRPDLYRRYKGGQG